MVIDDELSIVGSANLDTRSTRLNFELAALIYNQACCEILAQAFVADLAHSRKLEGEELQRLPLPQKPARAGARLLSPFL